MNIDQIDRDNLLRMVLAGRLSDLRDYAKALLTVQTARERVDASGRGGIRFFLPTIGPVKPDPEVVVLDQAAIDDARAAFHLLATYADPHGPNFNSTNAACNWFREHIPAAPPEPITAEGGLCAPSES